MERIRWFFQLFWIGICAVAMVVQSGLLLDVRDSSPWLAAFVFSATVFGYHFAAPLPLRLPAWIAGVAGGWCFLHLPIFQQLAITIPATIWLFYYGIRWPELAGLRRYPVLKPVAIALAWAWVTVWLPFPLSVWTGAGALFVGRMAFIFALALAYDWCDLANDRRQGFNTLVMQMGAVQSLRLMDIALLVAAGCAGLNVFLLHYTPATLLALLLSLVLSAVVIRWLPRQKQLGYWRKIGIDALMVVQLVLVWWAKK